MDRPDDDAPELLSPELLAAPRRLVAPAVLATGALAAVIASGWFFLGPEGSRTGDELPAVAQRPDDGILVPVSPSDPAAFEDAVKGLLLSDQDKARIRTATAAGNLDLGLLTVWDYMHQDGDVVAVTSAGFVQYVSILNHPSTVVLPYNGPGNITVTGLRDGGGGVTVAVASGTGPLQLRPLMVGESLQVRVP